MTCTKENDFLVGFFVLALNLLDLALLALSLLDFALRSHVSKSSKQQLVRVLGNQILTYDSERWKWMRWQVTNEINKKPKTGKQDKKSNLGNERKSLPSMTQNACFSMKWLEIFEK